MQFPRKEYWNGLPFPSSGDLPDPGIEPSSPALGGGLSTTEPPAKPDMRLALLNSFLRVNMVVQETLKFKENLYHHDN